MRVATRRLRAALRLFAPLLPTDFADGFQDDLRHLMAVLGHARDLDVLQAEIAEPVLQALPDEPRLAALIGVITEQRFDARQEATRFLRSPAYGSLVLDVLATVHAFPAEKLGAGSTANAGDTADNTLLADTLLAFAENRLRRLRKKVRQLATQASIEDPTSLHALRIGIKRLRYALEFFAPLTSAKAMRRMLSHLAKLQETLGQINDLANAGELLMNCADDDSRLREAVTLIGGWHGPRHQQLLAAIPAGLKHLGQLRLPKFISESN
jgi:adenylate cyclase